MAIRLTSDAASALRGVIAASGVQDPDGRVMRAVCRLMLLHAINQTLDQDGAAGGVGYWLSELGYEIDPDNHSATEGDA